MNSFHGMSSEGLPRLGLLFRRHGRLAAVCTVLFLLPCALTADPVDWTAYKRSFDVTFSGYVGSTTLVDFPVLIRLSKPLNGFDYSKCADGSNLRFSDSEGNLLDSEIDTWNLNGESLVWVKIPQLNRETKITAHYSCASPAPVTPANVWSEDYVGVWHLNESGVPMAESSGVSTPFSTAGGSGIVYGAAGPIGHAVDFSGGSTAARLSADDDDDLDGFMDFTFELWTKQEAAPTAIAYLLAKRTKNSEDVAYILYNNYSSDTTKLGRNILGISVNGTSTAYPVGSGNNMEPTWGEWCHQAFVRDTTANKGYGYLNGTQIIGGSAGSDLVFASASKLHLGNSQGNGNTFNGLIDELRISRVARSPDWIQASHDTIAKTDFAVYSTAKNDWSAYSHKFAISFENALPSGTTLQNFPVLVRVAEYDENAGTGIPGFLYSDCLHEDGGDLRFSDENGVLLQSEIDTWNTDGESFVWVKVPAFSNATRIKAYYGCALPGIVTPSEVWSEGYVGVWHLGENSLPLAESSGVSTSFSSGFGSGIAYAVSGAVGGSVDFSSGDISARVSATDDDDLDGFEDCTFEMWTKQDSEPSRSAGILAKRAGSTSDIAYYIYNNYDGSNASKQGRNIFIASTTGTSPGYPIGSGNNMVPVWGEWNHQAFVRDVSETGKAYGYVNGTRIIGATQTGSLHASAAPLYLGNSNGGSFPFNGRIDELRISRVARSQSWLQASHDTVAQSDFATYGAALGNSRGLTIFFR